MAPDESKNDVKPEPENGAASPTPDAGGTSPASNGVPLINPDLSEGVAFMRSAEAAGFTYSDMLNNIVNLALARSTNPNLK